MRTIIWVVALVIGTGASAATDRQAPKWKVFSNRAGWSISYPANWRVSSCSACADLTDPENFVNFSPRDPQRTQGSGSIMVTPLEDKPPSVTAESWFNYAKNLTSNSIVQEQGFTLDGLPARKVRYAIRPSVSRDYQEYEEVYVLNGSQAFSISFNGSRRGIALEQLDNYPIYLKMLGTFKIKR